MATSGRSGTQSIERALRLLREISRRGGVGWNASDLAEHCGLDRGTTHRILAGLVRERAVQQRVDRHYTLGPLLFELGLAVAPYADIQLAWREPLARLARRFEALAIVFLRSGPDWVFGGSSGESPYRGALLRPGRRRPLMTSAGGAAILTALPPDEAARILEQNAQTLSGDRRVTSLTRMVRRAQKMGFAFNRSEVTQGVHSFGVPLRDPHGDVLGAFALSGHAAQFPKERVAEVVAGLREEADALESDIARILEAHNLLAPAELTLRA